MTSFFMMRNLVRFSGSSLLSHNVLKLTATRPPSLIQCTSFSAVASHNKLLPKPLKQNVLMAQQRFSHGDHSKLWPIEKALSVALIFLAPGTFLVPNALFDNLFAVLSVIHMHWGLEACIADYVRPIILGPVIPKLTMGLLYVISALTLGGLIYFNVHDIGIGKTFRKLYAIKE